MRVEEFRRTWAEIDLDALEYNFNLLKEMNGGAYIAGMVKANSYGMGSIEISHKLEELGARYLCVASLDEAIELRHAEISLPILILGYTDPFFTPLLLEYSITQEIPSYEIAKAYSMEAERLGSKLLCHLKLDTGMGRLGFVVRGDQTEESLESVKQTLALPGLAFEGVFTHFAAADIDDEDSKQFTHNQYKDFTDAIARIEAAWGRKFSLKHCSNSAASVDYTEYHMDMIRPGISLYGLESFRNGANLKPCLKVKSLLGPIKTFHEGESVSYGRLWTAPRESRIGVLPVGYADGLDRRLTGQLSVMTIDGPAPIVGRICMDMCMVDLTDLPRVNTGSVVEVFGDFNTFTSIAEKTGTISYTVSCGIPRRIPRIYFEHGREINTARYL